MNPPLFDVDGEKLSVPIMEMGNGKWYKVTGMVTNRELPGDELVRWYRQRCGKGEEVHSVLKEDLAGAGCRREVRVERGVVGDSGDGVQSELGDEAVGAGGRVGEQASEGGALWDHLRAGRVVRHARRLIIRLARGHPTMTCSSMRVAGYRPCKHAAQSLTLPRSSPTLEATEPKSPVSPRPKVPRYASRTSSGTPRPSMTWHGACQCQPTPRNRAILPAYPPTASTCRR